MESLVAACKAQSHSFKAQGAVICLWATAKLGVCDAAFVGSLATTCIAYSHTFNAQEASNSLWAAAKLGLRDNAIIWGLASACVGQSLFFNAQDAANCLYAAATLGVRDDAIVGPLVSACVAQTHAFNAQNASNCLWAAATLGVRDEAIVGPLVVAACRLAQSFNAQDAANSLWAVAALGLRDENVVRALVNSLRNAVSLNVKECQQLLYVHAATQTWLPAPLLFPREQLDLFRTLSNPTGSSIVSRSQRDVAASISRLGFVIEQEVLVLDGLHAVDVLVHFSDRKSVAVEFDGQSHYLRWIEISSSSRIPEPNGATLFRDRLLREAGLAVVTIPYFEWSALSDNVARDAYISSRLAAAVA